MEERIGMIDEFLRHPMKIGVYHVRVFIEGKHIQRLWKYLKDYSKKASKRFRIEKPDLSWDIGAIQEIGKWWLTQDIEELLNFLLKCKKLCPADVKNWAEYGESVLEPEYLEEIDTDYYFFAQKAYVSENFDAFSIDVEFRAYPNFVVDIVGLTPDSIAKFQSFLASIPILGDNFVFTKLRKRHAERYVSAVYPAVASLWVDWVAPNFISGDITDHLSGALDYFYNRDWRTLIILSAISLEVILVDMYEELFHKPAPTVPLGILFGEITKEKKLPPEAEKELRTAIEIRNSAVHRGSAPLTLREATMCLIETIRLILWYYRFGVDFLKKRV